ncbi:dihydrolipoyl dehydrogenase family protein [Chloroflexota bacterium]
MREYDIIVIGSGCGMLVAEEAAEAGKLVAVVDKGPLGGTCLNLGCIPTKMLIHVADRIVEAQEAKKLGVTFKIENIDFSGIMDRMRLTIKETGDNVRKGISENKNINFYEGTGKFIDKYTLEVNEKQLKSRLIIVASGSRPFVPPIKGLDSVDYLTNESALQLKEKPESLIIIGGGYIAVEYGHFFAAMGTRVIMVEMADRLILAEEPEISALLQKELSKRMEVHTDMQALEIKKSAEGVAVVVMDKQANQQKEFSGQRILIAVGRKSNADLLQVEKTGVELDKRGFIRVNEYLETSRKGIYAIGDANGQQMFTHVSNAEAMLLANNVLYGAQDVMDYTAAPHAVYSHPKIASIGLGEEQAKMEHEILVGKTEYTSVAKGDAMMETDSFAKVILEKGTGKILGFHIIGSSAPELIQEVVNAMSSGGHVEEINRSMHIHPALSELVESAINNVQEVQ